MLSATMLLYLGTDLYCRRVFYIYEKKMFCTTCYICDEDITSMDTISVTAAPPSSPTTPATTDDAPSLSPTIDAATSSSLRGINPKAQPYKPSPKKKQHKSKTHNALTYQGKPTWRPKMPNSPVRPSSSTPTSNGHKSGSRTPISACDHSLESLGDKLSNGSSPTSRFAPKSRENTEEVHGPQFQGAASPYL